MSEPTAGRTGAACDCCGGTGMAPFGEPGDSCQACGGLGTVRGRTGEKGEARRACPCGDTHNIEDSRIAQMIAPRAGALEIAEKALRGLLAAFAEQPLRPNVIRDEAVAAARAALEEIARAR